MVRVLGSFFAGLAVGYFGMCLACTTIKIFAYDYIDREAFWRLSPQRYAELVETRTATGIFQVSLYGAILCGALCAMQASALFSSVAHRHRKPKPTREKPLSSEEFKRVLQSCLFVNLRGRTPEFLQGLLVGRLAESHPELAAKIDNFGEEHLAVVYQDVLVASSP